LRKVLLIPTQQTYPQLRHQAAGQTSPHIQAKVKFFA